jgi:hypothetical protein
MAVRNFILGSAAVLMTAGGAQAADLPVKAKVADPVLNQSFSVFFNKPATNGI